MKKKSPTNCRILLRYENDELVVVAVVVVPILWRLLVLILNPLFDVRRNESQSDMCDGHDLNSNRLFGDIYIFYGGKYIFYTLSLYFSRYSIRVMLEDGIAVGFPEESDPTDAVTESLDTTTDIGPLFARFSAPRSQTRTRIALVSDAHVSTGKQGTWKVFHRTRARLRTVIEDVNAHDVDAVVFAGDLTEDGSVADFDTVRSLLSDLDVPFVAVPGNHDVPKSFDGHETPTLSSFESDFAPDGIPFHRRMGGVDIIGLNSASTPTGTLSDCHDGCISDDQLAWLEETLPNTDSPIVVSHHNLPGLAEKTDAHSWRSSFPMRNATELAELFSRYDVPLHISGHLHVPATAETMGVRELLAPSLCSFPQAYLLLDIDQHGTTVRFVPTAGREDTMEAYMHAKKDSARSSALAEITVDRLASLPLVDEQLLVSH